jgi:calcium binding protein 39
MSSRFARGIFHYENSRILTFSQHQVFVANPKKPPQIEAILRRNKDKLLAFLKDFHNDKEGEWFIL